MFGFLFRLLMYNQVKNGSNFSTHSAALILSALLERIQNIRQRLDSRDSRFQDVCIEDKQTRRPIDGWRGLNKVLAAVCIVSWLAHNCNHQPAPCQRSTNNGVWLLPFFCKILRVQKRIWSNGQCCVWQKMAKTALAIIAILLAALSALYLHIIWW